MDDVVHIVRGRLSGEGRWAIGRLSRKGAYGTDLKLLGTDGDEAFGFEWREKESAVFVRQDEEWVEQSCSAVDKKGCAA